jgi:hypothetical protein
LALLAAVLIGGAAWADVTPPQKYCHMVGGTHTLFIVPNSMTIAQCQNAASFWNYLQFRPKARPACLGKDMVLREGKDGQPPQPNECGWR